MKWFRFYDEFQFDTKIRRMPIPHRYAFVVLLCMANRSSARGCVLMTDEDVAFELEMEPEDWLTLKAKFRVKELIEPISGGIKIVSWDARQFASDSSAERVRAYRIRKKESACNVTETLVKQGGNTPYVSVSVSESVSESGSGSGSEKKKKAKKTPAESECMQVIDAYNLVKPDLWSKVTKLTDARKKTIGKFWRENDRDLAACCELIAQACAAAKIDRWWSGQSGDYSGAFESLFRDTGEGPRYQRLADRVISKGIDVQALHASGLSDAQLQAGQAQYQKRQQKASSPKSAAYARYKAAKSSQGQQELEAC